jgi:hypothetical protein
MKNLRTTLHYEFEKLDLKWRNLPLKKQIRYVLYLFAFYMLLGVGVLVKVFYDLRNADEIEIEHINVPLVVDQDSINNIKVRRDGKEQKN